MGAGVTPIQVTTSDFRASISRQPRPFPPVSRLQQLGGRLHQSPLEGAEIFVRARRAHLRLRRALLKKSDAGSDRDALLHQMVGSNRVAVKLELIGGQSLGLALTRLVLHHNR